VVQERSKRVVNPDWPVNIGDLSGEGGNHWKVSRYKEVDGKISARRQEERPLVYQRGTRGRPSEAGSLFKKAGICPILPKKGTSRSGGKKRKGARTLKEENKPDLIADIRGEENNCCFREGEPTGREKSVEMIPGKKGSGAAYLVH